MGWFDEQIRQRMQQDDAAFSEAFAGMADAVMGQRLAQLMQDERIKTQNLALLKSTLKIILSHSILDYSISGG